MRNVTYLSPTALSKWDEGAEKFYLQYLTENRPPREPQNKPMAIGSAFDAFVKSYLHSKIFGQSHADSARFGKQALFEAQVEPHVRDWAWKNGEYLFKAYKDSGALIDLLGELQNAQSAPRFEFEVQGVVNGMREGKSVGLGGVTFLGKPDAAFVNRHGTHVILDWKVNGYCSPRPTSPARGYVCLRPGYKAHSDCLISTQGGTTYNSNGYLEHYERPWARQLAVYAWLLGEDVGGDFIVAVDQVVCKPGPSEFPIVRFAEHRIKISKEFQLDIYSKACTLWEIIQSGHIFRDLTREESDSRCALLDRQATDLYGMHGPEDLAFLELTR